jgi:hypothetical protein
MSVVEWTGYSDYGLDKTDTCVIVFMQLFVSGESGYTIVSLFTFYGNYYSQI